MRYYSFIRKVVPGPDGCIFEYRYNGEGDDPSHYLGEVDGLHYVSAPDGADLGIQSDEITWTELGDSLSGEIKAALRPQHTARLLKEATRQKIELEVGDFLDLISVIGIMAEFGVMGTAATLADKAGIVPMDQKTIQEYGERGAIVLEAVKSGDLLIRGQYEDPVEMIRRIMPRYTRLQQIVRDSYISKLAEIGL